MKGPARESGREAPGVERAFHTGTPASWFVNERGKTQGPFSAQRIAQLIHWGKISRRAYLCDEQLSRWVAIRCTAFAALFAPPPEPRAGAGRAGAERAGAEVVHPLGALRGGPWRLSTPAARRLTGLLTALSVAAGALQLASALAMSPHSEGTLDAATSAR